MTLQQLTNFVRIVELQSFSKAAAVIRIAQPALSRQVRHLEAELGSPLLVRHGWGVSVTPAGEMLLERARRLLADAEGTRDALLALSAEPRGRIAFGVPTSLAGSILPPLARRLGRAYPGLRPHFVDGFSAALHAQTVSGHLDLAVLYDDRSLGPLSTSPLMTEEVLLVSPPGQEGQDRSLADVLADETLILPARPNRLRLLFEEACLPQQELAHRIIEVDSLVAIIRMVQQGMGYTFLPFSTVADEVKIGSLTARSVGNPKLQRRLVLARPSARQATAAMAVVEQELRALLAEVGPGWRWRVAHPS
jgi:LysR family nitrogen assimilation transcriptional regulator